MHLPRRPRTSCTIDQAWKRRSPDRRATPTTRTQTPPCGRRCSPTASPKGSSSSDGNKRLALVAALTVLDLNGYGVQASDPELAAWILDLATGATPEQLAERIRAVLTAITD